MKTYNGWTNQATWKIAVRLEQTENPERTEEIESIQESFEDAKDEHRSENAFLISEAIQYFIDDVNWDELRNV